MFYRCAILGVLLSSVLSSQTINGSITGTLTDSAKAVAAAAKIVATNTGANLTYSTATNETGVYNLLFPPVRQYAVSATGPGFKNTKLGPFAREVNQIAKVDVALEVGELAQSAEITGVAPILRTESTAAGVSLTSDKLHSIPLNGRNFATLTEVLLLTNAGKRE